MTLEEKEKLEKQLQDLLTNHADKMWFKNGDTNLQFAPDSPRTLQIYVGCVNVFKAV